VLDYYAIVKLFPVVCAIGNANQSSDAIGHWQCSRE